MNWYWSSSGSIDVQIIKNSILFSIQVEYTIICYLHGTIECSPCTLIAYHCATCCHIYCRSSGGYVACDYINSI